MNPRYGVADQPLTASPGVSGPAGSAGDQSMSEPVPVTVAGQQYLVPPAVAEALSGMAGMGLVPDHYTIPGRPEYETEGYFPSEDHPMYEPATAWARKYGLPQEAFSELVQVYQDHEFGHYGDLAVFREKEMAKLVESFAPGMDPKDPMAMNAAAQAASEDRNWLTGLMGPALRDRPDLTDVIEDLYHLSDGALFVRALRELIGERTPGATRAAAASGQPKSLAELLYDHPTSR